MHSIVNTEGFGSIQLGYSKVRDAVVPIAEQKAIDHVKAFYPDLTERELEIAKTALGMCTVVFAGEVCEKFVDLVYKYK